MNMNINEKKALYAFGCPNREATVQRLRLVAALAPDPAAKKLFFALAVKLNEGGNGTLCSPQVCAGQLSCSDYGGAL